MRQKRDKNYVWVFKGERIILRGQDICYVHMDQRKTFVHTCRREYRVSGNLKAVEEMLKELPIVKTHNAFLVHMDFLESVSIRGAILKDGTLIPVSQNRWKQVREIVEEYYQECLRNRDEIQKQNIKLQKNAYIAQEGLCMHRNCGNLGA